MLTVQAPSPLAHTRLLSKTQNPSFSQFSGNQVHHRTGFSPVNSIGSVVVAGLALLGLSGKLGASGPGVTDDAPDIFTPDSQAPLAVIPYPPTAASTGETWISVANDSSENTPSPVPSNPFAPSDFPLAVINSDDRDRLRQTLELGKKTPSGPPKGKKGKYPTERPYPFRKGGGLRIDPYASSKPAQQVGSGYRAKTF